MTQIVSSISGIEIYAPSAGNAPTNSAEVSAIASAYQVVSSTATQLYAGTAFLTGVNDAPVSASRAGNAANAGMANSAYYDGTGRLISALPDSAAVSSIASSYAESAASGKQDTLSFSYDDDKISAINGSALAGQGGATGDYVEKSAMEVAIGSGNDVSATAFAFGENNSAASRSFAVGSYCSASASSIALGSGNRASTNSISVGYSGESTNRSLGLGYKVSANMDSIAAGYSSKAGDDSLAVGWMAHAALDSIAVGNYCYALFGYARGDNNSGTHAFMDGTSLRVISATAFGTCNLSGNYDSAVFVIGDGTDSATGRHDLMTISRDGEITLYSSTADTVGTGIMSSIRAISAAATGGVDSATVSAIASSYAESAVSSKLDESATSDFYSTSNPSSFVDSAYVDSAVSGKLDSSASSSFYPVDNPSGFITGVDLSDYATTGYVDSSVSGKLDSSASSSFYTVDNPSGFLTGVDLSNYATTSYVDSSVSSKLDSSASSSFYTTANESGFVDSAYVDSAVSGKADSSALSSYALSSDVSGVIDTVSSNSASWGGGVDSATVSSIASSYAESAASSKMDSSAINYTRTGGGTQIYASGTGSSTNQFSAKNDSAGAAIIAGQNARIRLWDTAATANIYASSVGGWNAASDLVSSQSANWGGSALQLSAGPGVKLNMVGNTLVVGADETVLWSGTVSTDACSTFTLSEYASHFDRLRFYGSSYANTPVMYECPAPTASTGPISVTYVYYCASTDGSPSQCRQSNYSSTNGLVFNASTHSFAYGRDARYSAGNTTQGAPIYKIVGINRTAGV